MLEEAVHHAHHADVLRNARNAGPQTADAAHEQIDLHSGRARGIEAADHGGIDQRIHLGDDARGLARAGTLRLALDEGQDPLLKAEGRHREPLPLRRLGVTRQEIEERRGVIGEVFPRREDRHVGVLPGGIRVVVAGAEVHVAADAIFAPHHQRDLAVRLQADQTVDDVHAGVFQAPRPGDVVRFVEPRLDLDQDRDLLAVLRGARERLDEGAVAARAVQRLLDGEHLGILGRFLDEADDGIERLVRMVQEDVARRDRRAHRRRFLQLGGDRRLQQLGAQLRARVGIHERKQIRGLQGEAQAIDVLLGELERARQGLGQLGGSVAGKLEADGRAAVPAPQLVLDCIEKVLGLLFVDVEVPVAGHAKGGGLLDGIAGEEIAGERGDDVLEQRERLP